MPISIPCCRVSASRKIAPERPSRFWEPPTPAKKVTVTFAGKNQLRRHQQAQRFLSVFDPIATHFRTHRYRISAARHRAMRNIRIATWNEVAKSLGARGDFEPIRADIVADGLCRKASFHHASNRRLKTEI